MRASKYLLATLKETPSDAEIISHQLMLRAGMIRRVAAGIYNWLPLGIRVVRKIEGIVREEMDRAGGQEILMPSVQPAELWKNSGRWEDYGPELLRLTDRHKRSFCLGPTHEEVVTMIVRSDIKSYRQLPLNLYQIQTKFRDEIRPRFGVMRGREFIMKDAYSFDVSREAMETAYEIMRVAYVKIFERLGLDARAVAADSGSIGGSHSNEFHVLANSGEDGIAICDDINFAANIETIAIAPSDVARATSDTPLTKVSTPNVHTIEELCSFLDVPTDKTVKTLVFEGEVTPIAVVLRGDHELNGIKAEKIPGIKTPLQMSSASRIQQVCGCEPGSIGPLNLDIPVFVDHAAAQIVDFVCGANQVDHHLSNVNWGRDLSEPESVDLRNAVDGDPCPVSPDHNITIKRGIEVGHIFQLGTKYSESLDAQVRDEHGKTHPIFMGCYGIGVTRIAAAAIEQNNDDGGIIWPESIAPFQICIVPIGYHKSESVKTKCDELYKNLTQDGYEVLLDDRSERPGVMFAGMDLIGIPHRVVIGERGLKSGAIEYRARSASESRDIPIDNLYTELTRLLR